jgi:hypothetical protein
MATIEIGSGYACVPSRACVPPSTLVGPQSFRNKDVLGVWCYVHHSKFLALPTLIPTTLLALQAHVDNRFDPHHGYVGPHPERGDKAFNRFHGNETRDGRGHAGGGGPQLETACMRGCGAAR